MPCDPPVSPEPPHLLTIRVNEREKSEEVADVERVLR